MNLSGMDDEIAVLSGTPDNAETLGNVIRRLGTDARRKCMLVYFDAVHSRA
jgi:type IV secretion system protein VirB4